MNFSSIREYFYKLQAILYLFVLVPLLLFGFVYLQLNSGGVIPPLEDSGLILIPVVSLITVLDWIYAVALFRSRIKTLPVKITLTGKLGGYALATYLRFGILSGGSILLAVVFYLTGDNIFAALSAMNIVWMSLLWPLPAKVCNDLLLKGDERKMVLYRTETLN
jgi:hypothetical protein